MHDKYKAIGSLLPKMEETLHQTSRCGKHQISLTFEFFSCVFIAIKE
jgi:hypothetical protein